MQATIAHELQTTPTHLGRPVQTIARELATALEALAGDATESESRRGDLRLACALAFNVLDLIEGA